MMQPAGEERGVAAIASMSIEASLPIHAAIGFDAVLVAGSANAEWGQRRGSTEIQLA